MAIFSVPEGFISGYQHPGPSKSRRNFLRVHGSMPQMSRVMMSSGAVETILPSFFRVFEERVEKHSTQDVIMQIYIIYSVYICIYIYYV